jgi:hypothetical protein
MPVVLIFGSPTDGFEFVGPLADREAAIQYADEFHADQDFWTAELEEPKPSEEARS